jgi:hypothetical protein
VATMATSLKTPFRKTVWLAMVLVGLLLPVLAAAHDHSHEPDSDSAQLADSCLLCQVVSQKIGPLPTAHLALHAPVFSLVGRLLHADSDIPRSQHISLARVRGPPAV